jgi:hypothetical protein
MGEKLQEKEVCPSDIGLKDYQASELCHQILSCKEGCWRQAIDREIGGQANAE